MKLLHGKFLAISSFLVSSTTAMGDLSHKSLSRNANHDHEKIISFIGNWDENARSSAFRYGITKSVCTCRSSQVKGHRLYIKRLTKSEMSELVQGM
jgi:hypothetical protein